MSTEFGYSNNVLQTYYSNDCLICLVKITHEQKMWASCPPGAFEQDLPDNPSGLRRTAGLFRLMTSATMTMTMSCSARSRRVKLEEIPRQFPQEAPCFCQAQERRLHRTEVAHLFQVHIVHSRPASCPKGGDISKIKLTKSMCPHSMGPFQRPVEGQSLPAPRPQPRRPTPRSLLRCPGRLPNRATTNPKSTRGKFEYVAGAFFAFDTPVWFLGRRQYPTGKAPQVPSTWDFLF